MTNLRDEARWLIGEISEAKRLARAGGKPQLANSAIEAGRIEEYDQDGTLVQIVGEQHDGTHTPVTVNGPVPPEPSAPAITAGIGSVEGRWSGKFAGDALSPMDLSHVALHASRTEVFTPSNETQLATITGELGDVAVVLLDSGEWTFGLVAVSKAGKWSGLSETVTIDVPDFPSPVDIQDELIRFDEVTGGLITEAGNLGNRLDEAEEDLAAHETRLGANDATIANLTGTVLPQLQTDLNKAKTDLAPLPGLIQQNTTKVNEAKTRLDTLDSSTLPGLTTELNNAKSRLATAETAINTTLPTSIANAKAAADMALLIAPVSTAAPTLADGTGRPINAIWTRIDASGNEIGYWRWTASGWITMAMTTTVIPNLSAAKITSGTIATARLDAAALAVAIASIIELNADRITSGKIAAAQIDVASLAAEIATVIQLNAGSITAGTLSADRLDASAVAAKVASVIQLNASRITAGTINTARLNVSEIAAQVATVIQLNADRITAGTIATARLNAQEIAAATAAFQTVDVKNLFVTTGTMTEAVINKLWADVVMSRKATFNMLAVGDFQNYLATGLGFNNEAIDWAQGLTPDFVDVPEGLTVAFKSSAGQGAKASTGTFFDVNPGDEYEFVVWVKADKPNSRMYIEMRDQSGAHAMVATRIDDADLFWGNSSYPVNSALVPTVWTKWRARLVPKAGVRQVRIGAIYFNHTAGTERGATVSIAGLSVKRRFGGEVIIDGSLKSKQIDVEDLAANTGFIADLTARIVKSEMFVGKEFFGGKFIGSYFWTDAAEAVGLKLDNQGLRVYGAEGGEPVTEIRANGGTVYSITDPATGDTLASLDRDGVVSGQELNIAGDPVFLGSPLLGDTVNFQHPSEFETPGLLDVLPRGMIARGFRNISDRTSVTNQEMEILEYNYVHEPGRGYRITVAPFSAYVGGGNAYGYLNVYVTTDGTRPSMSSTPTFRQYVRNQASGAELATFGGVFYNTGYQPAPKVVRIMITISSEGGTLSFHPNALASTVRTWVEDMGLSAPDTSIDRNGRMDLSVPTPVPPPEPPPVPKENYTQVWKATGYRSFDGNGRYTYADGTNKIYQGTAGYTGMLRSMVTFGTGSKGQTIIQALSGAKINSIKVKMRFDHWWSSAGGTAQIMLHRSASLASAPPAMTLAATSSKWPKPGTRTVSIPSSRWEGFKNGDWKGIGLGNGSSGTAYYGYARASSVSLEIKYTK